MLAHAIRGATAYMDLHSASAATPPFAFHQSGCEAARRYSAGFPVAYTVDDPTVAGQVPSGFAVCARRFGHSVTTTKPLPITFSFSCI